MTRQLRVSRTANGQEVMIRQVGKGKSLSETRGIFRCAEWKIENGKWKMNVRRNAPLFNHRAQRDTAILNSPFSILNSKVKIMTEIKSLSIDELKSALKEMGEKPFLLLEIDRDHIVSDRRLTIKFIHECMIAVPDILRIG